MLDNKQIVGLLRQVAAVFEVKDDDFFRRRAYENAAVAIENLDIPLHDLWKQNKLDEVTGLGPNLIQHLDELFKTGKVKHFEKEISSVPAGMFSLLSVRGIGPKYAYKIANTFSLDNPRTALSTLRTLIKENKLSSLEGFGSKLQTKIESSLKTDNSKTNRMLLPEALAISDKFIAYLRTSPSIADVAPLGSLRRRLATVGDIDMAISTDKPKQALQHVLKYADITKVFLSGPVLSRVRLKSGQEVDIKLSSTREWGSLLQHYTGSKLHNIKLRTLALESQLSLSEHGIKQDGKIKTFKSEASFYSFLGMQCPPPEIREGDNEINLASKKQLPSLINNKDIKGDLHIHSDYSFPSSHDIGESSLGSILKKASQLGYEYIGLSDHNPKITSLTPAQRKRIITQRKNTLITQYHECENSMKIKLPHVFIGLEIDIRPNGQRALEDEVIDLLDYAIVSVHSAFDLSAADNTRRIIKALDHPRVKILGHPTGRLLERRPGIKADWETVFEYCAENDKYLEINASPDRTDLPDDLIKIAISKEVKLVINTDAHQYQALEDMIFGVWNARRGWVQKSSVINCLPLNKCVDMLN